MVNHLAAFQNSAFSCTNACVTVLGIENTLMQNHHLHLYVLLLHAVEENLVSCHCCPNSYIADYVCVC